MPKPRPAFFAPGDPRPARCHNGPLPTTCATCAAPATCWLNARASCHPCVANLQRFADAMANVYVGAARAAAEQIAQRAADRARRAAR